MFHKTEQRGRKFQSKYKKQQTLFGKNLTKSFLLNKTT